MPEQHHKKIMDHKKKKSRDEREKEMQEDKGFIQKCFGMFTPHPLKFYVQKSIHFVSSCDSQLNISLQCL